MRLAWLRVVCSAAKALIGWRSQLKLAHPGSRRIFAFAANCG